MICAVAAARVAWAMQRCLRWFGATTVFLAAAWLISTEVIAQQRFTSNTSLLTLDVSVLDREGRPVPDLAPDDFLVSLNREARQVRAIAFLANQNTRTKETERASTTDGARVPTPATEGSSNGAPDPRLFVILIDDISIYPADSKGLFVAAERFVNSIPPRDYVGLASTSGQLTVNPSSDRTLLLARLKRAFGSMNDPRREITPYVGLMEAQEVASGSEGALRNLFETSCRLSPNQIGGMNLAEILSRYKCAHDVQRQAEHTAQFARINSRNQLDSYAAIIRAMAHAPGVKQLVILTGGVAVMGKESNEFVPVAKAAAAAGVQITTLMEEPDDNDMSNPFARELARDQRRMLQQAQTLAELSGGQFFRVIGQGDRFFQRVLTSASAVYRLGVELPTATPSDGQYTVKVVVNRPGVSVLASRYAVPPVPAVVLPPDEQMKRAITAGQLLYGVPVQMTAEPVKPSGGEKLAIRVAVEVSGGTPAPFFAMFGMIGPERRLQTGRVTLTRSSSGKSYRSEFLVPAVAATYDLRFAVVDASGAVGAVAQKLVVK